MWMNEWILSSCMYLPLIPQIFIKWFPHVSSELNATKGKTINILALWLPRTHDLAARYMLPRKEEAWVLWGNQECFAAQNFVRVRKHKQEMIYSGGEGVGREINAEEEWLYWPSDMGTGLKWQVSIHHAEKSAFRIFQAEETRHAKAGSQETPLPTLGIKSIMEPRECRLKRQEMKLRRWVGPECEVLAKNSDFIPKPMKPDTMWLPFP